MFTDWITDHIRNIYGWCDKDSEMEPGHFSIKPYLKYMLGDYVWGDFIVLNLISAMWIVRISIVRGDSCAKVRIRHNCELIESDVVILFNERELAGHYSAVSMVDQSKLKATSIAKTKDFDYAVDTTEVERKFHRLEPGQMIVKADFCASLVAKGEEFVELKQELDQLKKEKKKIRKILKEKKKLIRNLKRLLGNDKSSKDDEEEDDYNIETQTETESELPTNLPQVNPGDVICDICKRRFPGTGNLRKHIDKMHKGKGKFKWS